MSQWYLLNVVQYEGPPPQPPGTNFKLLPGKLVDDTIVNTALLLAAGGVLWPATDAVVAAAAAIAQKWHLQQGKTESEIGDLMFAAVAKSISGNVAGALSLAAVQHVSILISIATIKAQTSGTHFALFTMPANGKLLDAQVTVGTAVSGGTLSAVACVVQGGADANGTIIASHSVFTGASPTNNPIGSNFYPARGGQIIYMTLTATGDTLANATAGALTADLFFTNQA